MDHVHPDWLRNKLEVEKATYPTLASLIFQIPEQEVTRKHIRQVCGIIARTFSDDSIPS